MTRGKLRRESAVAVLFGLLSLTVVAVVAQNRPGKAELAAIEQSQLTNQQTLSRYTWQETRLVSLNGEAVDYRAYSVKIGAKGQYQRDLITESTGQQAIFKPKKSESLSPYGTYAEQLGALADQYVAIDAERLAQASNRGDVTVQREQDRIKLAIQSYLMPGDSVDLVIDKSGYRFLTVKVESYLGTPNNSVTMLADFAQLPDGTNHLSTAEVTDESKHLTMKLTNWSYQ